MQLEPCNGCIGRKCCAVIRNIDDSTLALPRSVYRHQVGNKTMFTPNPFLNLSL